MGAQLKVVFGPRSRADLRDVVTYVARASGAPQVAERLGMDLVRKGLSLEFFPERGRVIPELGMPDVREVIFKSYRIVYRVTPEQVQILRFWHASRGIPELNLDDFTEAP